ncbi:MAG: ribosome silencing factor [Pirellulales bacterium]
MATIATSRASRSPSHSNRSLQLALEAARTAAETRGQDIAILDMREQTAIFDYFVIVTGSSRRQLHGISEEIERTLKETLGERRIGQEGYQESRWILLDYGDVVVHLFDTETRDYYDLEQLWCAAKKVPFEAISPMPRMPK